MGRSPAHESVAAGSSGTLGATFRTIGIALAVVATCRSAAGGALEAYGIAAPTCEEPGVGFTPTVVSPDWSSLRELPPEELARVCAWYQNP